MNNETVTKSNVWDYRLLEFTLSPPHIMQHPTKNSPINCKIRRNDIIENSYSTPKYTTVT